MAGEREREILRRRIENISGKKRNKKDKDKNKKLERYGREEREGIRNEFNSNDMLPNNNRMTLCETFYNEQK